MIHESRLVTVGSRERGKITVRCPPCRMMAQFCRISRGLVVPPSGGSPRTARFIWQPPHLFLLRALRDLRGKVFLPTPPQPPRFSFPCRFDRTPDYRLPTPDDAHDLLTPYLRATFLALLSPLEICKEKGTTFCIERGTTLVLRVLGGKDSLGSELLAEV